MTAPGNEVLDARQVRAMAETLRNLDNTGELEHYLSAPNDMPDYVRREEGLIPGTNDQSAFRAVSAAL